ncbi:MAG: transcriptional regulator [Halobacteriales archaeon]|nr:transcriptional regulator [Halobacteriales archaeon]
MASTIEEIEFLARSEHRMGVLGVLADGSCNRHELCESTGASSPTIGRILSDFENRQWTVRDGSAYELTPLGEFVADRFDDLHRAMETEREIRDVWEYIPSELNGFTFEMVSEANITVVEPGDPYGPANRCASLYRETKWLRGFDAALTAPHHFEELYRQIIDGMDTEIILPPDVSENITSTYPHEADGVISSDSFTLWLNDDLPLYRVLIYDDRVGIGGYDSDSGVLQVYVDTDATEAREWAESTFESYRRKSRCLTPDPPSS